MERRRGGPTPTDETVGGVVPLRSVVAVGGGESVVTVRKYRVGPRPKAMLKLLSRLRG